MENQVRLDEFLRSLAQTGVFRPIKCEGVSGGVCVRGQLANARENPLAPTVWGGMIRNLLSAAAAKGIKGTDVSRAYSLKTMVVPLPSGAKREERLVCSWRIILPDQAIPILANECRRVAHARKNAKAMERGEIPLSSTAVAGIVTVPTRRP